MAEESKTMQVDPRVALQETAAKADADAAWYRNRCLLLAQRLFDQEAQLHLQAERIEKQAEEIEMLGSKLLDLRVDDPQES